YFEAYLRVPSVPVLTRQPDGHLQWALPEGGDASAFEMPVEVQIGMETIRIEMPQGRSARPVPADAQLDPQGRLLFESPASS
ncbi:MAG: hypothetical protein AAF170_16780, partial [Bacteroidota bacterium]